MNATALALIMASHRQWAYNPASGTRADLTGAVLRGTIGLPTAPAIPDIHVALYSAAAQPGALDMGAWHCGTTHCRAGWVVTLAGEAGRALETIMGTPAAGALIYLASDPTMTRVPDFYASNAAALADMAALANPSK